MEVSSHALALGRVDGITFDVAAFTNLSQDHLDFHRDMADYFAAKAQLFTPALSSRRAWSCIDDEWGRRLAATAEHPGRRPPAPDAGAHWRRCDDVDDGTARRPDPPDRPGQRDATTCAAALIGAVNLTNAALASVTPASTAGVDAGAGARRVSRAWPRFPAGWSRSTPASRSSPSSTTRTRRTRCARCWPMRAAWPVRRAG